MVHVMESNGNHGKPNSGFQYSNGTMSVTENKNYQYNNNNYNNQVRKFSLPTGNSYGNHKIPLDRMSSVASSQYTTANSVLKLVSDDQVDAQTKTKTWIFFCKRKWYWIVFDFLLIAIIACLVTVFVIEKRNTHFTNVRLTFYPFLCIRCFFSNFIYIEQCKKEEVIKSTIIKISKYFPAIPVLREIYLKMID